MRTTCVVLDCYARPPAAKRSFLLSARGAALHFGRICMASHDPTSGPLFPFAMAVRPHNVSRPGVRLLGSAYEYVCRRIEPSS